KVAGSIGLQHQQHKLSWGEQWVDTPLATVDYSRQLLTIYQGVLYFGQWSEQLKADVGYLNKYSPRSEEKVRKPSVESQFSEGLTYLNFSYVRMIYNLVTQVLLSDL